MLALSLVVANDVGMVYKQLWPNHCAFYFRTVKQNKDRPGCYPMCAKDANGQSSTVTIPCHDNDTYYLIHEAFYIWLEI